MINLFPAFSRAMSFKAASPPRLVLRPPTLTETLIRRDGANAMASITNEDGEQFINNPHKIIDGLQSELGAERFSALTKLVWCQLNAAGALFVNLGAVPLVLPLLFSLDMTTASLAATSIACFSADDPAAVSAAGGNEVMVQLLRSGPRVDGSLVLTSVLRALATLIIAPEEGPGAAAPICGSGEPQTTLEMMNEEERRAPIGSGLPRENEDEIRSMVEVSHGGSQIQQWELLAAYESDDDDCVPASGPAHTLAPAPTRVPAPAPAPVAAAPAAVSPTAGSHTKADVLPLPEKALVKARDKKAVRKSLVEQADESAVALKDIFSQASVAPPAPFGAPVFSASASTMVANPFLFAEKYGEPIDPIDPDPEAERQREAAELARLDKEAILYYSLGCPPFIYNPTPKNGFSHTGHTGRICRLRALGIEDIILKRFFEPSGHTVSVVTEFCGLISALRDVLDTAVVPDIIAQRWSQQWLEADADAVAAAAASNSVRPAVFHDRSRGSDYSLARAAARACAQAVVSTESGREAWLLGFLQKMAPVALAVAEVDRLLWETLEQRADPAGGRQKMGGRRVAAVPTSGPSNGKGAVTAAVGGTGDAAEMAQARDQRILVMPALTSRVSSISGTGSASAVGRDPAKLPLASRDDARQLHSAALSLTLYLYGGALVCVHEAFKASGLFFFVADSIQRDRARAAASIAAVAARNVGANLDAGSTEIDEEATAVVEDRTLCLNILGQLTQSSGSVVEEFASMGMLDLIGSYLSSSSSSEQLVMALRSLGNIGTLNKSVKLRLLDPSILNVIIATLAHPSASVKQEAATVAALLLNDCGYQTLAAFAGLCAVAAAGGCGPAPAFDGCVNDSWGVAPSSDASRIAAEDAIAAAAADQDAAKKETAKSVAAGASPPSADASALSRLSSPFATESIAVAAGRAAVAAYEAANVARIASQEALALKVKGPGGRIAGVISAVVVMDALPSMLLSGTLGSGGAIVLRFLTAAVDGISAPEPDEAEAGAKLASPGPHGAVACLADVAMFVLSICPFLKAPFEESGAAGVFQRYGANVSAKMGSDANQKKPLRRNGGCFSGFTRDFAREEPGSSLVVSKITRLLEMLPSSTDKIAASNDGPNQWWASTEDDDCF